MPELAWLLLPLAAWAGWYAANRNSDRRADARPETILGPEYFRGLGHLLDERPDEAIDVFIRMLEVTAATFETHLALGALFRRRGEVERAIRIHQNLVSRDTLSSEQRALASLELSRDYLGAGLLDRAEELLAALLPLPAYRPEVLAMLLDIYQQERDWGRALEVAGQMQDVDGQPVNAVSAQFHCERALQSVTLGDAGAARDSLARALESDARCARANILLGDMQRNAGDCREALACYARVGEQDIDRLPEVLEAMADCHRRLGTTRRMIDYLREVIPRHESVAPVLLQAGLLLETDGRDVAADFLVGELRRRPSVRGLARLIELGPPGADERFLLGLVGVVEALQDNNATYSCSHCGFAARSLHWQCPGCRHWDTVRPLRGVLGM